MIPELTISGLVTTAGQDAAAKGWHEKPASFGDRVALIHSEASEALEAFRETGDPKAEWFVDPDGERWDVQGIEGTRKPEGVPSELADVVIRIADLCWLHGIDLEKAITTKLAYNRTRAHRHGGKVL
jgi:NTP pyrophosphatase (non-canonical NTP hydrolase)